jgi:hypothetical protein
MPVVGYTIDRPLRDDEVAVTTYPSYHTAQAAASELAALVPARHMRIVRREPLRYELLIDRSHASAAANRLQVADAA